MVIEIGNPFSDDSDPEYDDVPELSIHDLIKTFRSDAESSVNEKIDSDIQDAIEAFKRNLVVSEEIEEVKDSVKELKDKQRRDKINEKRREKRRLEKLDRIVVAMSGIKPRYKSQIVEIENLIGDNAEKRAYVMRMEGHFLNMAQGNQYKSYEESLEYHYNLFLRVVLNKLRGD